jgi:PAS domain-containing protein
MHDSKLRHHVLLGSGGVRSIEVQATASPVRPAGCRAPRPATGHGSTQGKLSKDKLPNFRLYVIHKNQEEWIYYWGELFYACLDCVPLETGWLMADLRESDNERQLRFVTDNVRVGIAHCDIEIRYKFVNRHYAEWHGVTPEQVVGKRVPEIVGQNT